MTTPQPSSPGRPPAPGPSWSPSRVIALVLLAILALAAVAYGAAHLSSTRATTRCPRCSPRGLRRPPVPRPTRPEGGGARGRAGGAAGGLQQHPGELHRHPGLPGRYRPAPLRRGAGLGVRPVQQIGAHYALVCAAHSDVQGRAQNE
ncbi:hypothetical protein GXW82_16220 [Streptacidiphilus sp. 4-A2]|nr:hypothetical protein [Streptacidiphilus sp. 4-A2]